MANEPSVSRQPRSRAIATRGISPALLALLGVLVVAPPATHAEQCPAAIVQMTRTAEPAFSVDSPAYDSTYLNVYRAHISFDRYRGRLSLSASSGGRLTARVRVIEGFDIVGVPSGTVLSANLDLELAGWSETNCGGSGCGVTMEATLAAGGQSLVADANHIGPGTARHEITTTLSLPITFIAGTPIQSEFFLDFATGPGGGAVGECVGSYSVSGLPDGVRAIACHGADVTPAARTTWGALKSIYR